MSAAKGDWAQTEERLLAVQMDGVELWSATKKSVEEIRNGENPHFSPQPLQEEAVAAFWNWFLREQKGLQFLLSEKKAEEVLNRMTDMLQPVVPFLKKDIEMEISLEKEDYKIDLFDMYMVGLQNAYESLLQAHPAEVDACWSFSLEH